MNEELIRLEKAINNIETTDILNKKQLINLTKKFNYKNIIDLKQRKKVLIKINNCMYQNIEKKFYNIISKDSTN